MSNSRFNTLTSNLVTERGKAPFVHKRPRLPKATSRVPPLNWSKFRPTSIAPLLSEDWASLGDMDKPRPTKRISAKLLREWNSNRNGDLKATDFAPMSGKKAWWICSEGHEWEAVISSRTNGRGCPFCAGKRLIEGKNDFATLFPELANEWCSELNVGLSPNQFFPGSHTKVWWKCPSGHKYECPISKRTYRQQGCKYCSGQGFLTGFNDLATKHPEIANEWHVSLNGEVTPKEVQAGSNRKAWWMCPLGHSYFAAISNRTSKKAHGCPICSGQKIQVGFNDLGTTHPHLLLEWHPTLNGSLKPTDVTSQTTKEIYWVCQTDPRHVWKSKGYSRSNGGGCSVCRGLTVMPGVNDLLSLNPELGKQWHPSRNSKSADMVSLNSHFKAWWICSKGHEWEALVKTRSRGNGCRVCAGQQVIEGVSDLASSRPDLLLEWDFERNSIDPSKIFSGTNKKIHWICKLGHKWEATGNHRSVGQGCPYCSTGGYMISKPGLLYFIRNDRLGAAKIGITNQDSKTDRLAAFTSLGWTVIRSWKDPNGALVNSVETEILNWIRVEMKIPPFLAKGDLGKIAGWSETFSAESIPESTIVQKIEKTFKNLRKTSLNS